MPPPVDAPAQAGASSASDERRPEPLSFTLIIVSPSTGVTSPLTFPQLPAATTVSQLKEKIRDALLSKPSNDGQRLIHRGRLLGRDAESMLEIFGQETLASSEPQTLHLVLRPTGPDHPPPPVPSSTPFIPPQRVTTPIHHQPRPQSTPANPIHGMHAQQPLPGFQHLHQHQHQHHTIHQAEHWQNVLGQRLQALQRETARLQQEMGNIEQRSRVLASAHPDIFNNQHERGAQTPQAPLPGPQGSHMPPPIFRPTVPMPISFPPPPQLPASLQQLLQQGQNERAAAEARHGIPGLAGDANNAPLHRQTQSGRASPNIYRPDHTATYSREGIGPNGERWQMTVNETTSTIQIPQHPFMRHHDHHDVPGANTAPNSLPAMARSTERLVASQRAQNLQNNIGGATIPPPPGATSLQPNTSGRVIFPGLPPLPTFSPQPRMNMASQNSGPAMDSSNDTSNPSNPPPPSTDPTVYILSSPQGPQALLMSNSEIYYAPTQQLTRRQTVSPATAAAAPAQAHQQDAAIAPAPQDRAAQREARRGNRLRRENNPLEALGAHGNPGAGALGARMGPMIWLIIRLVGFVWFFTAGNNSWSRFAMMTALAVVFFIINTGILNGIAEALWAPVRRHVEAIIPLAGPEAALVPAANAAVVPQGAAPPAARPRPRRRHGELDEAEVAARLLLQQREANVGWWVTQIRRAEHAALLFIASLVPGVGERHIAAREAAANAAEAERQRQVEAEAAEAEAEAVAAAESAQGENPEAGPEAAPEAGSEQAEGGNQENQEVQGNPSHNTGGSEGGAPTQPVVVET